MTEPTSTTTGSSLLLATLIASLGPLLAEWSLIFVGGFVGSFLAVTALETLTLRGAALVLLRGICMSALFTGLAVWAAATYLHATVDILLLPVAGLIGWKQERLILVVQKLSPFGKKDTTP